MNLYRTFNLKPLLGIAILLLSLGAGSNPPTKTLRNAKKNTPDFGSGSVQFIGFTQKALKDFRIIPERGVRLTQPTNKRYEKIDGFWWRYSHKWYKIPNHCAVNVFYVSPPSYFRIEQKCHPLGSIGQRLLGEPFKAGFVPDKIPLTHRTDYPF